MNTTVEVNEILEKLPPAPADVTRWINRDIIKKSYLIYDKKADEAVCTRCGHKFRASRFTPNHNVLGCCPRCKENGLWKASGIGRKNLTEYFRVLIFTHRGNTVYGTLWEMCAEFAPMGQPELKRWLSALYVFSGSERSYYKHDYYDGNWDKREQVRLPHPPSTMNWYATPKFERTAIYEKNLEAVFRNSCLKYQFDPAMWLYFDTVAGEAVPDPYRVVAYMDLALKYQAVELLRKAGFEKLVFNKVLGDGTRAVYWRGKTLPKILRLNMGDVRKLAKWNIDGHMLTCYQNLAPKERNLSQEELEKLAEITRSYRFNEKVLKETGIGLLRWARWAVRENVRGFGDWMDYLNDCGILGLDLSKKRILLPRNFEEVHARYSEMVYIEQNREREEKLSRIAKEYSLALQADGLLLKIARGQIDLNRESAGLNHCVRTYGDRIAQGESLIYFIRKTDAPDVPYYTLEITPDGRIVQCRGRGNCSMTPEVKAFADMVGTEFNKRFRKGVNAA